MSKFDFLDDVFRRTPNRNALFGFDAELTTAFVAHTTLVDFNLVGEWPRAFGCCSIGMQGHRLTASTGVSPCSPLFRSTSLMFPFLFGEIVIQGCIRILNGEKEIGSKRRPSLLLPPSNGPTSKQGWHSSGKASNQILSFSQRNRSASQIFPWHHGTRNANATELITNPSLHTLRVLLFLLPELIDGHVGVRDLVLLQYTADIADVKANIRRYAEGCRFIFIPVQYQPRRLGGFNHGGSEALCPFNPSLDESGDFASFHPLLLGALAFLGRTFHPYSRLGHGLHPCCLWVWRYRP